MLVSRILSSAQAYLISLRRGEQGQTFVEYALVLLLVAVAVSVLAAWTNLGTTIGNKLNDIANLV
jgi:Flp pilus assembly pilin Flp